MLLRYRYLQPADGRYHYGSASAVPALRVVYRGAIPHADDEPVQHLLDRLVARHAAPSRPGDRPERAAGVGDILDLGALGCWQLAPVGFRRVPHPPLLSAGTTA